MWGYPIRQLHIRVNYKWNHPQMVLIQWNTIIYPDIWFAKCYINSLGVYSFEVDVFLLCQTQQNIKWLVVIDQHEPIWDKKRKHSVFQTVEFWLFHRAMSEFPRSWSKMSSKCRLWPTRALQTVKHVPPCLEKSTLTVPNMFHYCIEQREKTHDESWGKKQYPSPQLLSLDPIWAHPRWPARLLKKLLAVFGVISGQQVRETQGVTQQSGRSWDFRGPLLGKWLVGALEPWNFMTFHIIIGNVIIPTDFHSIIFQRGRYTTNQMMINVDPICFLMFFFSDVFFCHFSDAAT